MGGNKPRLALYSFFVMATAGKFRLNEVLKKIAESTKVLRLIFLASVDLVMTRFECLAQYSSNASRMLT